jgi:PAS domain S-box-containing protein
MKFDDKKKSLEYLQGIFETANDAIISTNKEGIITSFNKKAEEMYGYSREEIMEKSILTLFAPREIARQKKGLEAFKKAKTFSPIETPMETINVRKNGQEFPVEASISSLEVQGEHIFTSFIRDITGRKNIEHTLLQSEKLRSLGELAGGVAHDFNNVLAAILGRVQLLRMQIGPPPEKAERRKATRDLRKSLEVIEKAALDGTETIRRIQEFSRKRDDDKHFADVDINKVIDDALEFTKVRWKDEAETKGITIHIKENLSPLAPIAGSAPELREVVTNLINNAIDAMPQGGEIRLKTLMDNGHVVIKIADTGSGIPHALADRIFDPFFTSKGPQSTGLGMSVSYGIINRHRGTINFNSVEGEGTTFTIQLPFSEQTFERKKITALRSKKQRKAKILVIEDEQDVLELLKDILTDNGHEVETASHGRQGLKMFSEHHFDLVFTDLGMPEMSGWQVAKEVKKINKETPVALITGWEVQLDQSELKKSGVDLLVNKPFQVDEIRRLVDEGIDLQIKSKKTTKLTRNGKKKKTSARKNRNPGRK